MTEENFLACILQIQQGDRNGLKEIYEAYIAYIYGIVRKMIPYKEEAEDITSEFFIKLWEKAGSYRPGSGHKGWMATITRNLTIDHIRKNSRVDLVDFSAEQGDESVKTTSITMEVNEESSTQSIEDQVISDINMKEALATLNDKERQLIHLKIMNEMTFQEIADLLGEPLGTIAWRYREAVKKLRRCGYEESGR